MDAVSVRDSRVNEGHIRSALDSQEGRHAKRLARVEAGIGASDVKTAGIAEGFAKTLAGNVVDAVRFEYALGAGFDDLRALLSRAAAVRTLCFSVMARYDAEFSPGSLSNTYAFGPNRYGTYRDSIDMLSWSVLLHDPAVGAAEYGLPSVQRWGDAVMDELATFAGVPDVVPRDRMAVPQVSVAFQEILDLVPGERAAALDRYVRSWRKNVLSHFGGREPGSEYDEGEWCFDAAAAAVALDIDDSSVRDVPEYPGDLVDYSRGWRA